MNIADETLTNYGFSVGITILNQRIIYKDDIEFVIEFPCLLGHPVHQDCYNKFYNLKKFYFDKKQKTRITPSFLIKQRFKG